VLAEPPRQGWYWLVYLIPPALFLVGVYILYRAFQSMKKPTLAVSEKVEPDAGNDEYLRRVEEELKKRN
jgi:cytochrome c-type biogenesis protein CcmH/NrfF